MSIAHAPWRSGLPVIIRGATAWLAVACLGGCSAETVRVGYEEDLEAHAIPSWEEFLAQAEAIEGTDSYVFEGDMVVSEDVIFADYQARYMDLVYKLAVSQVWSARPTGWVDNIWDESERSDLTYCISDAWGPDKARARADFEAAAAQWMSAGNVRFRYVPHYDGHCTAYNQYITINVVPRDSGGGIACFPDEQCRYIKMNYEAGIAAFKTYTWLGAWTHEIGHRLGFVHEHYRHDECEHGSRAFRGLPPDVIDERSTMHYAGTGDCATSGHHGQLSALDRQGMASVYGKPSSTVLKVTPAGWAAAALL